VIASSGLILGAEEETRMTSSERVEGCICIILLEWNFHNLPRYHQLENSCG
jgi:hypothetical protein